VVGDPLTDEPAPFDVTLTVSRVDQGPDDLLVETIAENGTGEDGGEIRLRVAGSAHRAYGLLACVIEVERFINSAVGPEFRLDAALAMGAHGEFEVTTTPGLGLRVVAPGETIADAA
jgi:hypothetical protein